MLKITEFFIKKPKVANLVLIFLLLSGFLFMITTQNEGYPHVDFGWMNVSTVYPGASAKDIELKITSKLEDSIQSVNGIDEMTSWSIENFSNVFVKIDDSADIEKVKDDIIKAVEQVSDLPPDIESKPLVSEMTNDIIPVLEIAVMGEADYSLKRKYAKALERKLRLLSRVSGISKIGYLKREIHINADPKKLKNNYVSLSALMEAIKSQNFRVSSGDILKTGLEKKLVIESEFPNLSDVGNVIIRSGFEGKKILVSDITEITEDYEKIKNIHRYNKNDCINLIVRKKSGSDIVKASKNIQKTIEEFKKTLPSDIQIELIIDYSEDTKNLLNLVLDNAKLGFTLVIIMLILFLNFKVAFWTSLGIPFSIMFGFILFPFFDITLNFISLTAIIIVLGMLVDDAILVAENIFYYREQGLPAEAAAMQGVKEVVWPVTTTVLTTIVAFLPMLTMSGIMGKYMHALPLVISFTLLGSLFESIFILPSHIAHTKLNNESKNNKHSELTLQKWLKQLGDLAKKFRLKLLTPAEIWYEKIVIRAMTYRLRTMGIFFAIFVLSIVLMLTTMKFILFPSDDGTYSYVLFETERGTTLEETAKRAEIIEKTILSMPRNEIDGIISNIGQKEPNRASWGAQFSTGFVGNIEIHLTPISSRERKAKQIMAELEVKLKDLEGFTKMETHLEHGGPPVGKAVTVTFVSNNDIKRNVLVDKLKEFLAKQPGTSNIKDSRNKGKNQLVISFNYALMSRLGLNAVLVANTVRAAYDGIIVTSLRREGEEIDFRVILDKISRNSYQTINTLTVSNYQGKLIPLGQIISCEEKENPLAIYHYDGDRSSTVFCDIDTKLNTAVIINKNIAKSFNPLIEQIPDMRMIFGGEEKDTNESMDSLMTAFILALIGIYFLLVILFNSFAQPLLVMVTIPYALSGVIFAFFLHGKPFSFTAIIGVIGLIGVVVNNSLVMITFLNKKRSEENGKVETLAQAAKRRLRPILLTTFTTAAGLFPTAYGFGGDNPMIVPMILAVAWGLIFSTVISLILVPAIYTTQVNINFLFRKMLIKMLQKLGIRKKALKKSTI